MDVEEAYLYYKEIVDASLADRFFSDFEITYKSLNRNYDIGSLRYKDLFKNKLTRFVKLSHFPFLIFFAVDNSGDFVEVIRVFHERRNFIVLI